MNYFKTFIAYEDSIYSKLKRFIGWWDFLCFQKASSVGCQL